MSSPTEPTPPPSADQVRAWSADQLAVYLKPRITSKVDEDTYETFAKLRVGGALFIDKGTARFWMKEKELCTGLAYTLEKEALALGGNVKRSKDLREELQAEARARKSFAVPFGH
jgi:hypothetical protein